MSVLTPLQRSLSIHLLESQSLDEFIKGAFDIYKEYNPKTSYSELARKMGFSSRSYVRQIFLCQKKLNRNNYHLVAQGLQLSKEASHYLRLKIDQNKKVHNIDKKIKDAELKLRKSLTKKTRSWRKNEIFQLQSWPYVYSALGSSQDGRGVEDIIKITGLNEKEVTYILDCLYEKKLIGKKLNNQKYYPLSEFIDLGELSNSVLLNKLFRKITHSAFKIMDENKEDDNMLFHSAVFSVNRKELPELTKKLQDLLVEFASESEDSDSSELAHLSLAFMPVNTV